MPAKNVLVVDDDPEIHQLLAIALAPANCLIENANDGLEALLAARLARVAWSRLGFERTVESVVDLILGMYTERRWLIRALALFARTRPEALPQGIVEQRRRVYEPLEAVLRRHAARIAGDDASAAIRFGVFLVSTVARERLLFADAPLARITPISRTDLRRELVRTLRSYLTAEAPR